MFTSEFKLGKYFCFCSMLVLLMSCGNNESKNIDIAGINGPVLNLDQDNVQLITEFQNISMEGSLKYNVPKFKYSTIELSPSLSEHASKMTVSISLKDLYENKDLLLENQTLPGGRHIPGIPSGRLPGVAFSIENFKGMKIYLSEGHFGIFYPHEIGIENAIASFRYYLTKKFVGTISLIGSDDQGENSGFLLLIKIDETMNKQLKSIHNKF